MTTADPACGATAVRTDRPGTQPCAASCSGTAASTCRSSRRWASLSRGFGAASSRTPCGRWTTATVVPQRLAAAPLQPADVGEPGQLAGVEDPADRATAAWSGRSADRVRCQRQLGSGRGSQRRHRGSGGVPGRPPSRTSSEGSGQILRGRSAGAGLQRDAPSAPRRPWCRPTSRQRLAEGHRARRTIGGRRPQAGQRRGLAARGGDRRLPFGPSRRCRARGRGRRTSRPLRMSRCVRGARRPAHDAVPWAVSRMPRGCPGRPDCVQSSCPPRRAPGTP